MRGFFAVLLLTLGAGCTPERLEVSDVRFGLVCPERNPEGGSVCVETTEIPITDQGVCVYDGAQHPCTWYGFEFQYANARPGDEITCVLTSNRNASYGNPGGVVQEHTNRLEYGLKLETPSGRFFNPQYSVFNPRLAGTVVVEDTVCSFGSRELFRFRSEHQYQASPLSDP
jgi:hypothetical protein